MGIINWLADGLGWFLDGIVGVTGSYGLAIIIVTLVIRGAMYPLTRRQTKSMMEMKALQPKIKKLQEKFKDQPQEIQKRTLELYREHKVNPLGGCLPMLIQLPFLLAFFRVLQDINASEATQFLYFWDLSKPDPFFVFPVLSAATTYWQMTLTSSSDSSQKTMMMVMPGMIGLFSISFPAGLVLYWIVSNLFSIGQQWYTNKQYPMRAQGGNGEQ